VQKVSLQLCKCVKNDQKSVFTPISKFVSENNEMRMMMKWRLLNPLAGSNMADDLQSLRRCGSRLRCEYTKPPGSMRGARAAFARQE